MTQPIPAPYVYFGGKSRVADVVWRALGDVPCFVDPFLGSAALLLGRPEATLRERRRQEVVNDKDGFVTNFWRAVQADPDAVAHHANWPRFENDMHARHAWLVEQRADLIARLEGDPAHYDAKIAGWWVWGMSLYIGSGFCSGRGPWGSAGWSFGSEYCG